MVTLQAKEGRDACFTHHKTNSFSLRTAVVSRRHSADGTVGSESGSAPAQGPADSDRFHSYHQQYSDGAVMSANCLQQCSSSFSCLQDGLSQETHSHSSSSEVPPRWDQYNGSIQVSTHLFCQLMLVQSKTIKVDTR